jgi:hypothetical protein
VLLLLVICAGAARLTSSLLLGSGMEGMALRYALATLSAYLVLIVGLVAVGRASLRSLQPHETGPSEVPASRKRRESRFDKSDVYQLFDLLSEGAFLWAILVAAAAVGFLFSGAAGALAEIAFDVVVAGIATRQVGRSLANDLGTVIRRTVASASVLAIAVLVCGALLQASHPGAVSLTDVVSGNYAHR